MLGDHLARGSASAGEAGDLVAKVSSEPMPAISALDRAGYDELDDLALQCVATRGRACDGDDRAAALRLHERD
jgi:hypothetical protein